MRTEVTSSSLEAFFFFKKRRRGLSWPYAFLEHDFLLLSLERIGMGGTRATNMWEAYLNISFKSNRA
jgi:hypothetical protein